MPNGRVDQVNEPDLLRNHAKRIAKIENSDGSWPWVCVDDGSSAPCIPPTTNPAYTVFENGWTNVGSPEAPVSFKRFLNWVHIRGAFTGGADNTVVFTLPPLYVPAFRQMLLLPLGDGSGSATVLVDIDGTVTYVTQGAF